jgi:hypothetical protein
LRGEQRGDIGVAIDVVRKTVHQQDRGPIGRTGLVVRDAQHAGIETGP